jgi:hypothetical protein
MICAGAPDPDEKAWEERLKKIAKVAKPATEKDG